MLFKTLYDVVQNASDDGRTCKRLIDAIRVVHIVTLKHKVLIGRNGRQTRHQICKPNPCCAHLQYEMTLRQRDSCSTRRGNGTHF